MTTTITKSDADLVALARKGDETAFAAIYDKYADRLHSYCFVMLRDHNDASDALQETFVNAATKLGQLRNPEKLRPWLFAIARNEARAIGRDRARVQPEDDLSDSLVSDPDPAYGLAQEELKELVWASVAGLQERDRELMTLHLVEGLEGQDLANAVGVETQHLHVMVSRMKDRVEKALGALLIARLGREDCQELDNLLQDWDGRFSLDVRSSVTRHVESCKVCSERRSLLVAPANLLPSVIFIPATGLMRRRNLRAASKALRRIRIKRRLARVVAGAATIALLVSGGLILADVTGQSDPVAVEASTSSTEAPGVAESPVPPTTTDATESGSGRVAPPPLFGLDDADLGTTTLPTVAPEPPAPDPADLTLSTATLDLGSTATTGTLTLTNSGGLSAEWTATDVNLPFSLAPAAGTLAPGQSVQLTVAFDRTGLAEGDYGAPVSFSSDGTEAGLDITGSVEIPPTITQISANPTLVAVLGSTCHPNLSQITVFAVDDTAIASVDAIWTGTQETVTNLAANGSAYIGDVGPFVTTGDNLVTIVATDIRGNTASSVVSLFAESC